MAPGVGATHAAHRSAAAVLNTALRMECSSEPGGSAGAPREGPSPGALLGWSLLLAPTLSILASPLGVQQSLPARICPLGWWTSPRRPGVPLSIERRPAVLSSMGAVPEQEAADRVSEDEPALVARALSGDRLALGRLLERFTAPVRRVTYAILGDADEADDAAQDGLLQALVKLDRYDPTRPFGPWLLRIVANAAIDRRRRRTVRVAGVLGERLRAALDELPERYRAALVLFDVEGYSQAEIAQILGMAPGTVRSAVFHARRRLRRLMGDWKEES